MSNNLPRLRELVDKLTDARVDLELLFNMSSDMMCIAGADGYFRKLNPAWSILGYTTEELLNKPYISFIHPDDVAETQQVLGEMVAKDVRHFTNRYRCKDGTYRTLEWNASRWQPCGLCYAVARDVTDRKQEASAPRQ